MFDTGNYKKIKDFNLVIRDKETGYNKNYIVKKVRTPSGVTENFYIDKNSDSVQIFPITRQGRVFLVKQWRPSEEKEALELPGGGLNKGEDPIVAAGRELYEETGLKPGKLVPMGTESYGPYSEGKRHIFLAHECEDTRETELDENEFLKIYIYDLEQIREMIKTQSIRGKDLIYMGLDYLDLL